MKTKKLILPFILLFAGMCMQTNAATFTVTNTLDAGAGSLRQALADAANGDSINFSVTGVITVTSPLDISKTVTILGPGADVLAISGNNATRIFLDNSGSMNDVVIAGLEIKNAYSVVFGSAMDISDAHVTIRYCDIHNNTVGNYGSIALSGVAASSLIIENSSIHHNNATGYAAGIFIDEGSSLSVSNSTIFANAGAFLGQAIMTLGGNIALTNVTIAGLNTGSSAIFLEKSLSGNNEPASISVRNCIFDNAIPNFSGSGGNTTTSNGHNISNDGSMSFFLTAAGDMNNTSSLLDPLGLQDNGGTTPTVALQCNSPALDATTNYFPADQVGNARGAVADIGAYESTIQPLVATCSGTNVSCFGGATGTAAVTVTGGASTVIGLGPVGGALPYQGTPNSPAIYDTCNCPPGYVAVGFEGRVGSYVDQFKLKCRQLLPNGTLGSTLVNTCTNGNSQGGDPFGPYLSATNEALVKFTILEGTLPCPSCHIKGMNADSKSISEIYSGTSNAIGLTNIGGFTTNNYVTHPETAPDGNVIIGMINYQPAINVFPQGVQFRYAPVTDVPAQVQYLWSTGATTSGIGSLTAGIYTVTVTKGSCSSTTCSVTITEPAAISVDAGPNKIVYKGYPDSACTTLQSTISGGTPPLTRQWSTAGTPNLGSGISLNVCPTTSRVYYLTVTDANGCSKRDSVRVCLFDVRCGSGNKKVTLCHGTGSVTNPFLTLCILPADAMWHFLNHPGDKLGTCGMNKSCTFPSSETRMDAFDAEEVMEYLGAFPNPFSASTTIRFSLPENDFASVKVIDVTGRVVENLYDGATAAGEIYSVEFDGSRFTNGIYFLVMNARSGVTQTRKLVLDK